MRVLVLLAMLLIPAQALAQDADGDGYDAAVDCDDSDSSVYPGAIEIVADEVDQDCDGGELCWEDDDHDGYGSTFTVASSDLDCVDYGEADRNDDCDDSDATVHPGATEIPGDGIDQDCDSAPDTGCFEDLDLDGYGSSNIILAVGDPLCMNPGNSLFQTDCNDSDPAVNPAASDSCGDGIDNNCDGIGGPFDDEDGDSLDHTTEVGLGTDPCVADTDGDGSSDGLDCAPTDAGISPGATESVADGIDQDCDGGELCFVDGDGDGAGSDTGATVASVDLDCTGAGESGDATDCDDSDPTVITACGTTTGSATGTGTGAATGTSTGTGTGAATGTATGSTTGAATGTATGTSTGAATGTGTGTATGASTGTGAATGTTTGSGTGAATGTTTGAATGTGTGATGTGGSGIFGSDGEPKDCGGCATTSGIGWWLWLVPLALVRRLRA